jgi:hypothetical protein
MKTMWVPLERPVRMVLVKPVRTLLRARAWGERVQMGVIVELSVVLVRFTAAATTCLVAESRTGSVVFIFLFLPFYLSSK